MPWATFDDNYAEHTKVYGLTDAAFRLHTAGILYCSRLLTDGLISGEKVPTLVPRYKAKSLVELVQRGLWREHRDADVYEIHDYLQWNRSRTDVQAERERKRKAGRLGAERRWQT